MHIRSRILNLLSASSLVSGICLFAGQMLFMADLTGHGATVLDRTVPAGLALHQAANAPLATAHADAGVQLISGIALIVLAFFLHALAKSRNGERPVHITVKPKKKRTTWFWVEMHI